MTPPKTKVAADALDCCGRDEGQEVAETELLQVALRGCTTSARASLYHPGSRVRTIQEAMTPWKPFWPSISLIILVCSISSGVAADVPLRMASSMVLEASAASLAGGRARLTTTALRWQAGRYMGNYDLKVFPYAYKNEAGTLSIGVSEDALRKLSAGKPVSLTGTAQTSGTGLTRPVTVIAAPAGGLPKGKLTISITTNNGVLVFSPAYTLTGN